MVIKTETKYLFNGKEIRMTIAVRHPLIDEVKASASKCILDIEKGKLYVAYNTPFNASLLGIEVIRDF